MRGSPEVGLGEDVARGEGERAGCGPHPLVGVVGGGGVPELPGVDRSVRGAGG